MLAEARTGLHIALYKSFFCTKSTLFLLRIVPSRNVLCHGSKIATCFELLKYQHIEDVITRVKTDAKAPVFTLGCFTLQRRADLLDGLEIVVGKHCRVIRQIRFFIILSSSPPRGFHKDVSVRADYDAIRSGIHLMSSFNRQALWIIAHFFAIMDKSILGPKLSNSIFFLFL